MLYLNEVNGKKSTLSYDAFNRPVMRKIGSETVYYTFDGWSLIEEFDRMAIVSQTYVHGASIDEIINKTDSDGVTVWYAHDALGSTTHLTDNSGQIVEKYHYDVYGAATIYSSSSSVLSESSVANRFLFTGREWRPELNLYDYRNRVYSADLGRFIQTDPIRFEAQDVNLYRYVGNRSIVAIDPYGLIFEWVLIIGTIEQAIRTILNGYPGMDKEDYQSAAGDGKEPCCSNSINSLKTRYILQAAAPNVVRLVVDYTITALSTLSGPGWVITGGVSALDTLAAAALLNYATNKMEATAQDAIATYCTK